MTTKVFMLKEGYMYWRFEEKPAIDELTFFSAQEVDKDFYEAAIDVSLFEKDGGLDLEELFSYFFHEMPDPLNTGDIVTTGEKVFLCESVGWLEIDRPEFLD